MFKPIAYEASSARGEWIVRFNTFSSKNIDLLYCADNAGFHCCYPNYKIVRSYYNSYLLLLTTQGKGELSYRGKKYTLTPGTMFFIDCIPKHEYYTLGKENWKFTWIHFLGANSNEYHHKITEKSGPVLKVSPKTAEDFQKLIENILHLIPSDNILTEIQVSQMLGVFLHEILIDSSCFLSENASSNQSGITSAIEYIKKNYQSDIKIEEIAGIAHLSKYYFVKQFKSLTGYSPYEYLIKYRIDKSKLLLYRSSDSINSIAIKVGFNSTNSFISAFKNYENITPLQFRKIKVVSSE